MEDLTFNKLFLRWLWERLVFSCEYRLPRILLPLHLWSLAGLGGRHCVGRVVKDSGGGGIGDFRCRNDEGV
jgi:hypothetical protein